MATITIMDPVTRIEGHMKVEVTVDNGRITDAHCTGTLFRGFETLLVGRDPLDAPVITQRICGVCPISHGMASVMALEDAVGVVPPRNALILRNLTLGSNFIMSHILHFYLLAALDYVQGPATSPWTPAWDHDLRDNSSLDAVAAHLPQAIEARRRAHEMGAVFGGKMPSSHTYIPGGFTAVPKAESINQFRTQLNWLTDFIRNVYIPDVQTVAGVYSDYLSVGQGYGNLLAYGVFDLDETGDNKLLGQGYVESAAKNPASSVNEQSITESVSYSWYADNTDNLKPESGVTQPAYPKQDAYSWLKSPRYEGKPYEVGPLARMWINGDYQQGVSVMDRHAARAREALKIADAMNGWLDNLNEGSPVYGGFSGSGAGLGWTEAPRGALGHWVEFSQGKINHYQVITPTCWNASPRDGNNQPGPMEKALIGATVMDPDRPIEALRIIHSFDPCLSCAVHLMRPRKKPLIIKTGGCR